MRSSLRSSPRRRSPANPRDGSVGAAVDPSLADVLARGFHTIVRGHAFAARRTGSRDLPVGTRLRFVRESDNPADPFAVAVWTQDPDGWRIGYLDRTVSARLAPWFDEGRDVEATVRGWTNEPGGRWRRPVIAVSSPVSAPVVAAAEAQGAWEHQPVDGTQVAARLWGRPPGARRRVVA